MTEERYEIGDIYTHCPSCDHGSLYVISINDFNEVDTVRCNLCGYEEKR